MEINFADAKKAVRRGTRSAAQVLESAHDAGLRGARSAGNALDVAHEAGQRGLVQARRTADDVIDIGDHAAHSTVSAAKSAHEWMEAKPHLATLAALAVGVVIGVFFSPRR